MCGRVSKLSAVAFILKLYPSRRELYHRRGALQVLKEGAQKLKGGTAPCYDALADSEALVHIIGCCSVHAAICTYTCYSPPFHILCAGVMYIQCMYVKCL